MDTVVYTAGWLALGLIAIGVIWFVWLVVAGMINDIKTKMKKHTYRIKYVSNVTLEEGGRDDEKGRCSFWNHSIGEFLCQAHDDNEAFATFYKNAGVGFGTRFLVLECERLSVYS